MKRIILILALIFASTSLVSAKYRGDVNEDGILNITDVAKLVNIILGNDSNYQLVLADVNQDGVVNIQDVSLLVKIVLGKEEPTIIEDSSLEEGEGPGPGTAEGKKRN